MDSIVRGYRRFEEKQIIICIEMKKEIYFSQRIFYLKSVRFIKYNDINMINLISQIYFMNTWNTIFSKLFF